MKPNLAIEEGSDEYICHCPFLLQLKTDICIILNRVEIGKLA